MWIRHVHPSLKRWLLVITTTVPLINLNLDCFILLQFSNSIQRIKFNIPELETFKFGSRLMAEFKELLVLLEILFNVSRFRPALKWNRFSADLRRGSNSLNSDSNQIKSWFREYWRGVGVDFNFRALTHFNRVNSNSLRLILIHSDKFFRSNQHLSNNFHFHLFYWLFLPIFKYTLKIKSIQSHIIIFILIVSLSIPANRCKV